jgi:predicted DNA-binding protein with PD1-like motif
MKSQTIDHEGQQGHLVVFETDDELMAGLRAFVREHDIRAAHFTGIGALQSARLAYFDWERREYDPIDVDSQVEVLVLAGDVAWKDDEPVVHAHVVLGRRDGSTIGGHVVEARVRPTLELALTVGDNPFIRRHDSASGIALLAPRD